jgi:hypothetical protein
MSLPSLTTVATAAQQLLTAALDDRTDSGSRQLFDAINEALAAASRLAPATYLGVHLPGEVFAGKLGSTPHSLPIVEFADETLADLAALVAAESLSVGDVFVLAQATADLTDNALATAKGSATAAGDVFMLVTATTVLYLATEATLA